jgi:hypothetical protein
MNNISRRRLLGALVLAPLAAAVPAIASPVKRGRGLTSSIQHLDEFAFQSVPTGLGRNFEVIYVAPNGDPLQWGETPQTATTLKDALKMVAVMGVVMPSAKITIHMAAGKYQAQRSEAFCVLTVKKDGPVECDPRSSLYRTLQSKYA